MVFGWLQRVNACLRLVCDDERQSLNCRKDFLDCGIGLNYADATLDRQRWIDNTTADDECLNSNTKFAYGIYQPMGYQVLMIYLNFVAFEGEADVFRMLSTCSKMYHFTKSHSTGDTCLT